MTAENTNTNETPNTLAWEDGCKPWACASKDATRPSLQIVWLKGGYAVATDTWTLSCIKAQYPPEAEGAGIEAAWLAKASKLKFVEFTFEADDFLVARGAGVEMRTPIRHAFTPPRHSRVMDVEPTANARLLLTFPLLANCAIALGADKVSAYGGGPYLKIDTGKPGCATVVRASGKESLCVLMPVNPDCGDDRALECLAVVREALKKAEA